MYVFMNKYFFILLFLSGYEVKKIAIQEY